MDSCTLEGTVGELGEDGLNLQKAVVQSIVSVADECLGRPRGWLKCPENATPQELVDNYSGLIVSVVNKWHYKFPNGQYDFDDLFEIGVEVLLYTQQFYRRLRRNPKKKKPASFTTYFVHSFRNAIKDLLNRCYTKRAYTGCDEYVGATVSAKPHKSDPFRSAEFKDSLASIRAHLSQLPRNLFNFLVEHGNTSVEVLAQEFDTDYEEVRMALLDVRAIVNWTIVIRE